MSWSYEKLWTLLVKKKITKSQLVEIAGITTNVISQMNREEPVHLKAVGKICHALKCKPDDIYEWSDEEERH